MLQTLLTPISKAPLSERQRLDRLLLSQEAVIRNAFAVFLSQARSPAVLRQARLLLEARNIEGVLQLIDSYVIRLGSVVTTVFQDSGIKETEAAISQLGIGTAGIAITFDVTNPRASAIMRRSRLKFIRDFTRSQRDSTRQALVTALREGFSPIKTARVFRDSIGLTEYQRNAVNNYRRLLEENSREALTRDLRDRRSDRSIERALELGEPLSAAQINRMVSRYHQNFLQLRAETIARTESLGAVGLARQESLEQVLEQAQIPPDKVTRIWGTNLDGRERATHHAMNGQRRGLRVPFQSPSGARLMYPGDNTAPAEEIINCRCVVTHHIDR